MQHINSTKGKKDRQDKKKKKIPYIAKGNSPRCY